MAGLGKGLQWPREGEGCGGSEGRAPKTEMCGESGMKRGKGEEAEQKDKQEQEQEQRANEGIGRK